MKQWFPTPRPWSGTILWDSRYRATEKKNMTYIFSVLFINRILKKKNLGENYLSLHTTPVFLIHDACQVTAKLKPSS